MSQSTQTPCALLRQRKTVPLTGTVSKLNTLLDFQSILALEYAQAWLGTSSPLKVPVSGLMRRALAVYMQHLAKDTTEPRVELIAVKSACSSRTIDPTAQQAALERLQTIPAGQALPPFSDVLEGPGAALLRATHDEAYERLITSVMVSPQGRRLAAPRPPQDESNGPA